MGEAVRRMGDLVTNRLEEYKMERNTKRNGVMEKQT